MYPSGLSACCIHWIKKIHFKGQLQKFLDAGIQVISTSISITIKFEEMTDDDEDDENDKHL